MKLSVEHKGRVPLLRPTPKIQVSITLYTMVDIDAAIVALRNLKSKQRNAQLEGEELSVMLEDF